MNNILHSDADAPNKSTTTSRFDTIYEKYGEHAENRLIIIYNDAYQLVFDKQEYHTALPLIQFIISIQPENEINQWLFAIIHHNLGNKQLAKEAIETSLKINPNNMMSNYDAARIFLENNDANTAKKYAQRACHIDNNNGYNHYISGKICITLGLLNEAQQHINKCIELGHFLDHAYYLQGQVFRLEKKYTKAANALTLSLTYNNTPSDLTKQEIALLLFEDNQNIDQTTIEQLKKSLS